MPKSKRDVDAALLRKGFLEAGGDHDFFIYYSKAGKKTRARTKTSHGKKIEIDDSLLGEMARQCFLTLPQFRDLVDCPMDRDMLEAALVDRGVVDPTPPASTSPDKDVKGGKKR
ncbi:MAG: hypothetical protein IPG35_18265 [Flavobacteriales bacterium]|nr:hypothetical protein [Flavobacteriales bacterium]